MRNHPRIVLLIMFLVGSLAGSSAAQVNWLHPHLENGISIEAAKADFSPDMNPDRLVLGTFSQRPLSDRFPLGRPGRSLPGIGALRLLDEHCLASK